MRARTILPLLITLVFAAGGFAAMLDFNGTYRTVLSFKDPWCGTAIEIKKIRFNKYRIDWELITGEHTVVDLVGKAEGDTIDFRKRTGKDGSELYGYTYTLTEGKNRLVVSLVTPDKKIVCSFIRKKEEK